MSSWVVGCKGAGWEELQQAFPASPSSALLSHTLLSIFPQINRDLLEELMDDEEEFLQLNLSSRPKREERRKQRERERLEREMAGGWVDGWGKQAAGWRLMLAGCAFGAGDGLLHPAVLRSRGCC